MTGPAPHPMRNTREPIRGLIHAVLGALLCALLAPVQSAGAAPAFELGAASAYAPSGPPAEAHGWLVVAGPTSEPGTPTILLVHLAPRRGSAHGFPGGSARRARVLESFPAAIAASGRRVYLVNEDTENRGLRLVHTLEAVPTPLDGVWTERPADWMTTLPPLPGAGVLLGFAAPGNTPTALLREDGAHRMLELVRNEWRATDPPPGLGIDDRVSVFASGDALAVVRTEPSPAVFVRTPPREDDSTGDDTEDERAAWERRPLRLPAGATPIGLYRNRVLAVAADEAGTRATLLLTADPAPMTLAEFDLPDPAIERGLGIVAIPDESGRLAILWPEHEGEDDFFLIREVSLSTGLVLYDGPVRQVVPISAGEFRLLAAVLIVVLAVSLFVVIRPGGDEHPVVLPAGTALAPPAQRFVATVIDAGLCVLLVSAVSGVGAVEIISGAVLLRPGNAWAALPAVFVVGAVYGTLAERLFAATAGKLLMGCRVVRDQATPGGMALRLGWGAALTRNIIKWALPPVAALAVLDPTGRHRGDLTARAVVVVRAEPEPDQA